MYFSSHSSDKQYFLSQKIDENVVFLATTHYKSGLTRRELSCVVTRNETLSSYRNYMRYVLPGLVRFIQFYQERESFHIYCLCWWLKINICKYCKFSLFTGYAGDYRSTFANIANILIVHDDFWSFTSVVGCTLTLQKLALVEPWVSSFENLPNIATAEPQSKAQFENNSPKVSEWRNFGEERFICCKLCRFGSLSKSTQPTFKRNEL